MAIFAIFLWQPRTFVLSCRGKGPKRKPPVSNEANKKRGMRFCIPLLTNGKSRVIIKQKAMTERVPVKRTDREGLRLRTPHGRNGENHSRAARDKRCRPPALRDMASSSLSERQGGTVQSIRTLGNCVAWGVFCCILWQLFISEATSSFILH